VPCIVLKPYIDIAFVHQPDQLDRLQDELAPDHRNTLQNFRSSGVGTFGELFKHRDSAIAIDDIANETSAMHLAAQSTRRRISLAF